MPPRHRVGRARDLPARSVVDVAEESGRVRRVLLLKIPRGGVHTFTCIDAFCAHQGAALSGGDVAIYDGRLCITCPVHLLEFDVATGENIERGEVGDGDGPRLPKRRWTGRPRVTTGGFRQRSHGVVVEDGVVFIELQLEGEVESDAYAHKFLGQSLDW